MPVFPTISAKVHPEHLAIIDSAATIQGCSRSLIVANGALQFAQLVIAEYGAKGAAARKAMRRAKARLGGLARSAQKRNT